MTKRYAPATERNREAILAVLKDYLPDQGTVLEINKDYVLVDIGFKSEGVIDVREFVTAEGEVGINIGDVVDVLVEQRENDDGLCVLSKEKADKLKIWEELAQKNENDEVVEGVIVSRVKGGLQVDIGVRAFLPGSQMELRPTRNLDKFIGNSFKFKIIKFNKRRGNIVLSRRALLEKERERLKSDTLQRLKEGAVTDGIVKNITEYGAFVDLGGIDGLLHITDMSWTKKVTHPSEVVKKGDQVQCVVLSVDKEKKRLRAEAEQLERAAVKDILLAEKAKRGAEKCAAEKRCELVCGEWMRSPLRRRIDPQMQRERVGLPPPVGFSSSSFLNQEVIESLSGSATSKMHAN